MISRVTRLSAGRQGIPIIIIPGLYKQFLYGCFTGNIFAKITTILHYQAFELKKSLLLIVGKRTDLIRLTRIKYICRMKFTRLGFFVLAIVFAFTAGSCSTTSHQKTHYKRTKPCNCPPWGQNPAQSSSLLHHSLPA